MATYIKRDKLKTIMKAKKFRAADLAKDIGVSRIYIYRILNEDLPIGSKLVEGLLKKTGYKFEELFYFDQNHTHSKFNLTGNAPENPVDDFSNVKIDKVSFEKTKRACEASGEFEKRKEAQCVKPQTSRI